MSTAESVVYVIGAEALAPVKIGVSTNLPGRLKSLQPGAAFRLTVLWFTPGSNDLEFRLHSRFRPHRTYGEWFDLTSLGDPVTVVQEAVMQLRAGSAIWTAPEYCADPEFCYGLPLPCRHFGWLSAEEKQAFRATEPKPLAALEPQLWVAPSLLP
ncbi:GIY-YIG nuclease family protein [Streptomyces heilongjiangensis]|uniref:GIY-YIG nuclease family protein n=1 Tax=Streptomyces heilongjiangensis TaxID=945052 RepID=A0ABW1BJJ6_9ACTN|nr:GIY-YIG nuclease family protein [Streptomyces heilongjiangensis]MDC2951043.1 GIY-YIG nuclease family protein [Streptomyces heilongjiangensis]